MKAHGFTVEPSGKEWKITRDGQFLMSFAVSHKQGGKREVKPVYLRRFHKLIEE